MVDEIHLYEILVKMYVAVAAAAGVLAFVLRLIRSTRGQVSIAGDPTPYHQTKAGVVWWSLTRYISRLKSKSHVFICVCHRTCPQCEHSTTTQAEALV